MSLAVYVKAYKEAIEKKDEAEQFRIEKKVRTQLGMNKVTLIMLTNIEEDKLCKIK